MKTRKHLFIIGLLSTVLTLGVCVFVNQRKQPTEVEAQQHINNYADYTYCGNYYDGITFDSLIDGMDGSLRTTLTNKIKPVGFYTYSGTGSGDLGTILQYADEDPDNSSNMVYFYTRDSVAKNAASTWNREHCWPQSLSSNTNTNNWGTDKAGADLLHIRPTYNDTNSARGNLKYGDINKSSPRYYGSSNMLYGYTSGSYFEPIDSVKGDVARIIMYIWTAYTGYSGYSTIDISYVMQSYDVLLKWHTMDKPDALEGHRNDYCETSKQKNRNPFVDHPELAWRIFGSKVSGDVLNDCMTIYPSSGSSGNQVPATDITVSPTSLSLETGQTGNLTATLTPSNATNTVTWSSNNPNVATVSQSGVVTAVSAGTATITAAASSTIKATCTVTVTASSAPIQNGLVASYVFESVEASTIEYSTNDLLSRFNTSAQTGNGLTNIVSSVSSTSKVYPGYANYTNLGIKFGSSSAGGSFALSLDKEVTKVVVEAAGWGTSDTLKVGNANAQAPGVAYTGSNPIKTLTYQITSSNNVTFTFSNRGFIKSIDFYVESAQDPVPTDYLTSAVSLATLNGKDEFAGGGEDNIVFSELGIANSVELSTKTIGCVTITGDKGTNSDAPKYYTSGSALRFYGGNTLSFTADSGKIISEIEFSISSGSSSNIETSKGTLNGSVWSGEETSITFTNKSSSQIRFTSIKVTYAGQVSVENLAIRFGAKIPEADWTTIKETWSITDYGVLLIKTPKTNEQSSNTFVQALFNPSNTSYPLFVNKIRNNTLYADPELVDGYYTFTVKINITDTTNDRYSTIFYAAPFICVDGTYIFLNEVHGSVNSLAVSALSSGDSELSNAALKYLSTAI